MKHESSAMLLEQVEVNMHNGQSKGSRVSHRRTAQTSRRRIDNAVRAIINAKYERCVQRVVYRLRRMSSRDWQGDDAPERTLWDHWKREMQCEHSLLHNQLEALVEDVVLGIIETLPHEDGALLTLMTRALDDRDEQP